MNKNDTGICPHCNKEFIVILYGYKRQCPNCYKKIDIFPDENIWIETKWGHIGLPGLSNLLK